MIVLDDQISYDVIIAKIAAWYPGAVVSIRESRPHSRILDPEVPTLLRKYRQPTFVTINHRDFFNHRFSHESYCIICFRLEQLEAVHVPDLLRLVLGLPEYRTKSRRMGKVISCTRAGIIDLAV